MKTAISKRILCVALAMVLCFAVIGAHGVTPAKAADVGATYEKVTDVTALKDGDKVIFAYTNENNKSFAMAAQNTGNYRDKVDVAVTDDKITVKEETKAIAEVTLEKSGDNWKLKVSDGYLYYSGTKNYVFTGSSATDETYQWTISKDATSGIVQIQNVKSSTRLLQYNTSSPRFACYTGSQKNISVYKYAEPGSSGIDTSNLKITWDQCKLYLGKMPEIRYTLKVENPNECPITGYGYQVWAKGEETEPGEPTAEPVSYDFATNGYITTGGMNAYEITNRQWIRAYVIVDGQYIYSDAIEYSIYPYVNYVAGLDPDGTYGGYKTSELQATVKAFKEYGEAYATMWANKIG